MDLRPQPKQAGTQKEIDFALPDLDGKTIQLADFRGKKVIVFAWASW